MKVASGCINGSIYRMNLVEFNPNLYPYDERWRRCLSAGICAMGPVTDGVSYLKNSSGKGAGRTANVVEAMTLVGFQSDALPGNPW